MNHAPKTGRRIVSKGAYARLQARRASLWFQAACFFGMTLFVVGLLISGLFSRHPHNSFAVRVSASLVLLGWAGAMYYAGCWHVKQARAIEKVVPLTR